MTAPCPSCQRPTGNDEDAQTEITRLLGALTNVRATMGERIASAEKITRDVMAERDAARADYADLRETHLIPALNELDAARAALAGAVTPQVLTAETPEPPRPWIAVWQDAGEWITSGSVTGERGWTWRRWVIPQSDGRPVYVISGGTDAR